MPTFSELKDPAIRREVIDKIVNRLERVDDEPVKLNGEISSQDEFAQLLDEGEKTPLDINRIIADAKSFE